MTVENKKVLPATIMHDISCSILHRVTLCGCSVASQQCSLLQCLGTTDLARIDLPEAVQQRSQLQTSLSPTAYKAAMHEGDAKSESYVSIHQHQQITMHTSQAVAMLSGQ